MTGKLLPIIPSCLQSSDCLCAPVIFGIANIWCSHRTRNIDPVIRQERLNSYIVPLSNAWGSAELTNSLSSFESFCALLGLDKVQEYMINNRVHEIKDFSSHQLDEQALQLQADLQEKFRVLPIRGTKAFITCSTEKLKKGSQSYTTACSIWHDSIPTILPNLLKFITSVLSILFIAQLTDNHLAMPTLFTIP